MWKIALSLVALITLLIIWWILHSREKAVSKSVGDSSSFLDDLGALVEEVAEVLVPHLPYAVRGEPVDKPSSPMTPRQSIDSPQKRVLDSPLLSGRVTSRSRFTGEHLVASALTELLGSAPLRNQRPNFLQNPRTRRNLELDCWYPELKLAVEYQGIQHYEFPNPFHRSQQEFEQALYRDNLKRELCDQASIYLIPVPCTVDDVELRDTRYVTLRRSSEDRYTRLRTYLATQLQIYYEAVAALERTSML